MNSPSLENIGDFEIEAQQETPWIQTIKEMVVSFRDRIFSKKEPEVAQTVSKPEKKDFKVLDHNKITQLRMLCGRYVGEWLDAEDVVEIHEALKSLAGKEDEIADFLWYDPNVIIRINDAREHEADLALPLKQEIDRLIVTFVGRYMGKDEDQRKNSLRHSVKVRYKTQLAEKTNPVEQPEETQAAPANVVTMEQIREAHTHLHPKPAQPTPPEKPEDDEPEPIEPETKVA